MLNYEFEIGLKVQKTTTRDLSAINFFPVHTHSLKNISVKISVGCGIVVVYTSKNTFPYLHGIGKRKKKRGLVSVRKVSVWSRIQKNKNVSFTIRAVGSMILHNLLIYYIF